MGKKINALGSFCFIAFTIELILGFNGKLLMLGSIPIREILFGLATLGLITKVLIATKV